MATLIVRASVFITTVGVDLVSVDGKVDQEPSHELAHAVHATTRMCGCPWEAIRLGFQLHLHKIGEIRVNSYLPLHITCAPALYFLERDNKKNVPTVIDGLLSLRGSATEVPNRNRKLLLGLLISSAASWDEGVGIVLCAKPAALLYENIGLSGFQYIISRVTAE